VVQYHPKGGTSLLLEEAALSENRAAVGGELAHQYEFGPANGLFAAEKHFEGRSSVPHSSAVGPLPHLSVIYMAGFRAGDITPQSEVIRPPSNALGGGQHLRQIMWTVR